VTAEAELADGARMLGEHAALQPPANSIYAAMNGQVASEDGDAAGVNSALLKAATG